jgi:hypothetical protein
MKQRTAARLAWSVGAFSMAAILAGVAALSRREES